MTPRELTERAWRDAVEVVRGDVAVRRAIHPTTEPIVLLAMGKAALAMTRGAMSVVGKRVIAGLAVTKDEPHGRIARVRVISGNHPLPGLDSVVAGRAVWRQLNDLDRLRNARLIVLLSGGASALLELPRHPWTIPAIRTEVRQRLAAGDSIHTINAWRKTTSQLKGGQAAEMVPGRIPIDAYVISDVEGDDLSVIGSGPFRTRRRQVRHCVVANLPMARSVAARSLASTIGAPVWMDPEFLSGTVESVADRIVAELNVRQPAGYVAGGEPVMVLPGAPGYGGRATHLAALLNRALRAANLPYAGLVAGTDGSDGPTDLGGAFVDPAAIDDTLAHAITTADTGTWAIQHGTAFRPGPTGTNVNDLVLLVRTA
jgi:hydroxypyruvate reductase